MQISDIHVGMHVRYIGSAFQGLAGSCGVVTALYDDVPEQWALIGVDFSPRHVTGILHCYARELEIK